MKKLELDEIHGFNSLGEFERFSRFVHTLVTKGALREIETDEDYEKGLIYGGKWFENTDTQERWRLIPPDIPFKGLWERIDEGS